jgi:hypothetical protein
MSKREWYIAVCDVSGTFAANPASFEAATIYGPYTKEQADEADALSEEFPEESFTIVVFKAEARPPFRSLIKTIKDQVKDAIDFKDGDEFYGKEGIYKR